MTAQRARHSAITPEAIADVIDTFYGRVRHDSMLGPIFARHVVDWAPHLLRMNAFWRSVLLRTGEFQRSDRGSPPVLHAAVGGLGADHFARWLTLFSAALQERLEEGPAKNWKERAQSIGDSVLQHVRTARAKPRAAAPSNASRSSTSPASPASSAVAKGSEQ